LRIKNKDLPLDFKFGVTENLNQRENSLSKTKSPIKYMILKAWEIPYNAKREKVENLSGKPKKLSTKQKIEKELQYVT
jgi:hypothetical protein